MIVLGEELATSKAAAAAGETSGLGLVAAYAVAYHHRPEDDERLTEIDRTKGVTVIALRDDAGVVFPRATPGPSSPWGATALDGHVAIVNGQLAHTADADAFDLLGAGHSTTDSFSYVMKDAAGATSTALSRSPSPACPEQQPSLDRHRELGAVAAKRPDVAAPA